MLALLPRISVSLVIRKTRRVTWTFTLRLRFG
jgi:hypothetical protein